MLKELPAAKLETGAAIQATASGNSATLAIDLKGENRYARLIRMRAVWDGQQPYLSMYSDNYFDLFPGEAKTVSLDLKFPASLTAPLHGRLILAGSNMAATEIPITVNP